jgi:hypothetical protein
MIGGDSFDNANHVEVSADAAHFLEILANTRIRVQSKDLGLLLQWQ